jgi:hypothetical protein
MAAKRTAEQADMGTPAGPAPAPPGATDAAAAYAAVYQGACVCVVRTCILLCACVLTTARVLLL